MEELLFYFFSVAAIFSGTMVIGVTNPIHSVLFLVLVFFSASALLLLLGVEFLALILLIVYVGAIAVLFLFVVMMLNIKVIERNTAIMYYFPIGALIGFIFLLEISVLTTNDFSTLSTFDYYLVWADKIEILTNIQVIGLLIYTYYCYPFIIAGMVLLVSMVGAIVLTMYHNHSLKKQLIYKQVERSFEDALQIKE
uniref:NADH dehydrogenase subunit 6 n=1 Tax=Meteora sporadica TaxID=2913902 RepID=UPI0030037D01|nr:NADH dehydrogenase subunit 6 [Meteora sporadica]